MDKGKNEDRLTWKQFHEAHEGTIDLSIFLATVALVVAALIAFLIFLIPSNYEKKEAQFTDCLEAEIFTREECFKVVGLDEN